MPDRRRPITRTAPGPCGIGGSRIVSYAARSPACVPLCGAADDEVERELHMLRFFIGGDQLHGGVGDVVDGLLQRGKTGVEPLSDVDAIAADDGQVVRYFQAVLFRRTEQADGRDVRAAEDGSGWIRVLDEIGEDAAAEFLGIRSGEDDRIILCDAACGQCIGVSAQTFRCRAQARGPGQMGDAAMSEGEQVSYRPIRSGIVVDGDGVHRRQGRAVDAFVD